MLQEDFGPLAARLFLKIDIEGVMTRGAGNPFQYFTTCTENIPFLCRRRLDPCSPRVGVPSYTGSGWAEEGQDEISTEASAFHREEVELAKPFLIWHLTKTSH